MAQKIVPNIWFNGNAQEAVDFYVDTFGGKIINTATYPLTQEEGLADFQLDMAGRVLSIEYELMGYRFIAINADDTFKPNMSISFMVHFDAQKNPAAKAKLDEAWAKLVPGGNVLMALDSYGFSEHYGWLDDKYGVSRQLILVDQPGTEDVPAIMPSLGFSGFNSGKAEEALEFYSSLFKGSVRPTTMRRDEQQRDLPAGTLAYGDLNIDGEWLVAMDTDFPDSAKFSEGVSLAVLCKDQEEIDYFWERLSTVTDAEQCGWCKDKYDVSWQVEPENMDELMSRPGAYKKMMEMHKLVIADF